MLEKNENGFVELTRTMILQFVKSYGFTQSEFSLLIEGRIDDVLRNRTAISVKIIENNYLRRSYKKVITKETQAIRVLRCLEIDNSMDLFIAE